MTDFLPPVLLKLGADISEYLAKLAFADQALHDFAREAPKILTDVQPEFGRAGLEAGQAFADGFREGADSGAVSAARAAADRLDEERGRFEAGGNDAGNAFSTRFLKGLGKGLSTGLKIALRGSLVAMIPAAVGAATQLVGALAPALGALALIPAAVGAAASALIALKVAFAGVGTAISAGWSGDLEKFNQALEKLAPNARAAVRALVALKPQFDALKRAVQDRMFAGFAAEIKSLTSLYLPLWRTHLVGIADDFNRVFREISQLTQADGYVASVRESLGNLRIAVGNVLKVLPGLVSGFNDLFNVGSRYLPSLTAGFGALGDRFGAFMAEISENGQLDKFIRGGIDALLLLMPMLADLGGIVSSLVKAMSGAAGEGLGAFGSLLSVLDEFLKSAGGMEVLTGLFGLLGQLATALAGAFSTLLPVMGTVLSALFKALGPIVSLLTGQFLPVVVKLISTLATALVPVIEALGPALLEVLAAFMPLVTVLGDSLGPILIGLAPVLAQLATSLGHTLADALVALLPLFVELLPPLSELVVALLPSLIPLIKIVADIFAIQAPLIGMIAKLIADVLAPALRVVTPIVAAVAPILEWVAEKFHMLVGPITEATKWFMDALHSVENWKSVGQWFSDLWDSIVEGIHKGVDWLLALPGKAWAAIKALPGVLRKAASDAVHGLVYAISYGVGKAIVWFGELKVKIPVLLAELWTWIKQKFHEGVENSVKFVRDLYDKVVLWFTMTKARAVAAVTELVTRVVAWIKGVPDKAKSALSELPGKIKDAVSNAGTWLLDAGKNVVSGLVNGIRQKFKDAVDLVKSLGRDIVKGFNDAVGNKSPSKLFATAGANVVAGFVKGVTDNASKAVTAVAGMLSNGGRSITAPRWSFAGHPSAVGMVSRGIVGREPQAPINIRLTTTLDGKTVHTQLIPHAQRYKTRNGTTGLS